MNQRVAVFGFEEFGDIGDADFHFQSGGYAVEGLDALAGEPLAVLVQVNESGSHHQASDVDRTAPAQRSRGDAGDLAIADADVAHRVERGFGIDDAAAFQHEIVLLGGKCGGRE